MKSQPIIILVALLLAVSLCGCEVVFTHAPAGKLTKDKALVGNWINEEKDKQATTLQLGEGAGGEIKVSFLPSNPDDPNPFFTAKILIIANHSYMVLNPTNEDRDKGFLIARYEIKGDELIIWIPNEEKFKTLIQEKRIIGEAQSMDPRVTDSADNIAKLLASTDIKDAFETFGKFRRIRR